MIQVPEAPPPPPLFGTHPSPQHLPAEMERLNLDHGVPPYSAHSGPLNPSVEGRFVGPAHQFDTSLPFDGAGRVPITYEGWSFTKERALRPDQKETWALVFKTPMSVSQSELREMVTKWKKGKSATDQLASSDMNGFKRKQVDRLIVDRTRTDPDHRFEYRLGALKLGQKPDKRQGRQTVLMQVILKRQVRNGLTQPSSGYGRVQELDGEIVDLTGAEDSNYSADSYSTGTPGYHGQPSGPGYSNSFTEHPGGPYIHDARFMAKGGPQPQFEHQHINTFPEHPGGAYMREADYSAKAVPHHFEEPAPHDHAHGHVHEIPHNSKAEKGEKNKKDKHHKDDKKDKIEVHQKKEKKHKSYSDTSSDSFSDADSFDSKTYTDKTPDTIYSGSSGRSYHREKKPSTSHKQGRHGSRSHNRGHSPVRQVYRERRRKSPIPLPRKGSTRYEYEDYDIITSERHHDRDRAYRSDRRPSQAYERERPSLHARALSYDDDRHHRAAYMQPRRLQSYANPADLHAEKEELKWEIEEMQRTKLRENRERERAEQDRLELKRLERQRLEMEIDRERQERDRAERDRLDRLDRDRFERGRFDKERMERDRFDRERFDRGPYAEPPRRYPTAYDTRRDDRYYGY